MSMRLNRVRFVCNDGDKKGIHVKSNFEETVKLDGHTDECLHFTNEDLIVVQNKLERSCEILLEGVQIPSGFVVLKPSRQRTYKLFDKQESEVKSEMDLVLGPGESCTIHSANWIPAAGAGAVFPV